MFSNLLGFIDDMGKGLKNARVLSEIEKGTNTWEAQMMDLSFLIGDSLMWVWSLEYIRPWISAAEGIGSCFVVLEEEAIYFLELE